MADSSQRRRPTRRTPRVNLSAKRLKQRDAQDALSAWNTIADIMHVTGTSVELTAMPQAYDMVFVVHVGPVDVVIMPADSRVHLKAEGLNRRILQTAADTGHFSPGQLEQLVAYLRYAGMLVPELRFETLPDYARSQLHEEGYGEEQAEQRPSLTLVPSQQGASASKPLSNQRSLPPRRTTGNQRQEYARA